MKSKILFFSIIILQSNFLFAQEDPEPVQHLFSVRDLYYSGGFSTQGFHDGTLSDFRMLAPNSSFLQRDLSNFTENNGYTVSTGGMVTMSAGLNFRDKRKNYYRPSPQLRIGFSYFSGADISNSLRYTQRTRFDTVTSSSGQTVYLDSVFRSRYNLEHGTKQLRLDLSVIFRTSRMNRWSFYGGAGMSIGYSISSYTSIAFRYRTSVDSLDLSGHSILANQNRRNQNGDSTGTENFSGKNGLCYSFYFPVGIDFRVGRRIEFLRHVHLFYEMRPGFYYLSIPELRHYKSPGMNVVFGMRIAID